MSAQDRDESELDPNVLDALALSLPTARVPASLKDRLLSLAGGKERYLPFLDRIISIFDLGEPVARDHLYSVDDAEAWEDMLPGVRFRDFECGPAVGEAHGGLVRLAPGEVFPMHQHVGQETVLLLQGTLEDDHGKRFHAGDTVVSADGSQHEVRNVGDDEVIYAALVVAIQFVGEDEEDDD